MRKAYVIGSSWVLEEEIAEVLFCRGWARVSDVTEADVVVAADVELFKTDRPTFLWLLERDNKNVYKGPITRSFCQRKDLTKNIVAWLKSVAKPIYTRL